MVLGRSFMVLAARCSKKVHLKTVSAAGLDKHLGENCLGKVDG